MKKVFAILIVIALAAFATQALAASLEIEPAYGGHEKVGLEMKREWRAAMASGDLLQDTSCIVRMKGPVSKRQLKELKKAGLKVKSVLKTVVTGRIEIGNLPLMVAVDGVKTVDSSKRVHFK